MAWWDHEELKEPRFRSDRYITSFPSEYTEAEVKAAQRRLDQQEAQKMLQAAENASKKAKEEAFYLYGTGPLLTKDKDDV